MVLTVLIIIVVAAAVWAWEHRRDLKLSWQLPGPFVFPLIGISWRFLFQENIDAIDSVLKPFEHVQKPIGVWLGTKFMIIIDNVKDIETVLTSPNCVRDKMYDYIKDTVGYDGIFTSHGEIWRRHRRLVSPSFSEKVVLSYVTIFDRNSRNLTKRLAKMVNKEPFDIRPQINDCTLDAFTESTFSLDVDTESRTIFHRIMPTGQALIGKRFFLPWYQSQWIWKLSGYAKLTKEIATTCREQMSKIVQKVLDKGSSDVTFLERLLRISEENDDFTLEDVKAEANNALIAGTDTSAASIAYTTLLLAMHPEHQERVFEELKDILPTKDTPLRPEHIAKMKYLDLCIKESLRLFPIVSLMSKTVKTSVNLSGYEVHPGVSIVIPVNYIQRKKEYWGPNAHIFDPAQFSPENISKVNRYAFLPFSNGPRNCVGNKYAYVAMKSILAGILRNYRFTSPLKLEDLRVRMKVNIYLLNNHMVQIYERND